MYTESILPKLYKWLHCILYLVLAGAFLFWQGISLQALPNLNLFTNIIIDAQQGYKSDSSLHQYKFHGRDIKLSV